MFKTFNKLQLCFILADPDILFFSKAKDLALSECLCVCVWGGGLWKEFSSVLTCHHHWWDDFLSRLFGYPPLWTHCANHTGLSPDSQLGKQLFLWTITHEFPILCLRNTYPSPSNGVSPGSSCQKSKGLFPGYLTTVTTLTVVCPASFTTYTFRKCYTFPSENFNLWLLSM